MYRRQFQQLSNNHSGNLVEKFTVFIFILFGLLSVNSVWAADVDFHWTDYRAPFQENIRVFQYGKHKIESVTVLVNLPEDFIKSHDTINIALKVESHTRNSITKKAGFQDFRPNVRINNAFIKRYSIPASDLPRVQNSQITIDSKDLKVGENTLQFSFRWNQTGWYCSSEGCGFEITEMYFEDVPRPTPQPTRVPKTPTPRPTNTPKRPTPTPTPSELERLLEEASEYLDNKWYLTPKETNAFDVYKHVLIIDPENQEAREKLREIMEQYKRWGNNNYSETKYNKAVTYYERYLLIANYFLNTLQEINVKPELDEVQKQLELCLLPTPTPTAIQPTPTPTLPPATPTPSANPTPTFPPDEYPSIRILKALPAQTESKFLTIQGIVTDDYGIKMILVGTPKKFVNAFAATNEKQSTQEEFQTSLKLDIGRNEIRIEAIDSKGQRTKQVFDVERIEDLKTQSSEFPELTDEQIFSDLFQRVGAAYIVAIGIENYQDSRIESFRFARENAQGIYDLLIDPLYGRINPEKHSMLLVDEQVINQHIKKTIGKWLYQEATEKDIVVIYFSGCYSSEDGENYFVLYDTEIDDLYSTALSFERFFNLLNRIPSSNVLIFLDVKNLEKKPNGRSETFDKHLVQLKEKLGTGRLIITSSYDNQDSLHMTGDKYSTFIQRLLQGLRGEADENRDGTIDLQETQQYLQNQISYSSQDGKASHKLQIYGTASSEIPLTFNGPFLKKTRLIEAYRTGKISVERFEEMLQSLDQEVTSSANLTSAFTSTPSVTPTPLPTMTLSPTPSATPTPLPTIIPSPTPSVTPTALPTSTPTPTEIPTPLATTPPTPTATSTALPTTTTTPTATSTPLPITTPTPTATSTPHLRPTETSTPANGKAQPTPKTTELQATPTPPKTSLEEKLLQSKQALSENIEIYKDFIIKEQKGNDVNDQIIPLIQEIIIQLHALEALYHDSRNVAMFERIDGVKEARQKFEQELAQRKH